MNGENCASKQENINGMLCLRFVGEIPRFELPFSNNLVPLLSCKKIDDWADNPISMLRWEDHTILHCISHVLNSRALSSLITIGMN